MRTLAAIMSLLLAGCAGHASPAAPTQAATPPAASAGVPASSGGPASGAASGGGRSSGATPRSSAAPVTSPTVDPQDPQDLRGAPVTVAGTVHVSAGCVTLDAGAVRWVLVGPVAATLRNSSSVTVRGRPAAVPPGCPAQHALDVQTIG